MNAHPTRTRLRTGVELLTSPITSDRMSLVWRLFGFVPVLLWVQYMGQNSAFVFGAEIAAASLNALALSGLVLLVAGPSLLVLFGVGGSAAWFFATVTRGQEPTLNFIADEYLIQAGLPILVVIVSTIHVGRVIYRRGLLDSPVDVRLRDEIDDLHARIVRLVTVTTLGFAGVHKLNADFFAEASCAGLGERLLLWWDLPFALPIAGPIAVVTLELLAAAMLLVYPRVGILLVIYAMTGLGHIGPAAFAATCIVMSLAFLERGDLPLLRAFWARHWGFMVAVVLVVIGASFSTYRAEHAWLRYGLLEGLIASVTCMVIGVGVARIRRKPRLRRRLMPAAIRWWRRPAKVMPGLTSWLALILIVNCMSPYLGVKYRFSVAMLSNLRADHLRWNSYVVPEWVRLRGATPHATVVWEPFDPRASKPKKRHVLANGLYSGAALSEALQDAVTSGARGRLTLSYRNEAAVFELPADSLAVTSWAKQVPSSVVWQDQLGPGDEPQRCIH